MKMNIKLRFAIPAVGGLVALAGAFAFWRFKDHRVSVPDRRPPFIKGMETFDSTKLGSLRHADCRAHREKLVAAVPYTPFRPAMSKEVAPASLDCPCAPSV